MSKPDRPGGADVMVLGLGEGRRHARRRRRAAVARWIGVLVAVAGLVTLAFMTGSSISEQRVARLETRTAELRAEGEALRRAAAARETARVSLAASRDEAVRRLEALQARYDSDAPQGEMRELHRRMVGLIDSGVPRQRIEALLSHAGARPRCPDGPVTRRFILPLSATRGVNNAVGFAERTITVTGQGAPSRSEDGNPQAWFDPAEPVTLHFTLVGGRRKEISGRLPLHHSLVSEGREHRFTARPGPRSFVLVTWVGCELP